MYETNFGVSSCFICHIEMFKDNEKKVGLVLSGGGAKGVAHIGC